MNTRNIIYIDVILLIAFGFLLSCSPGNHAYEDKGENIDTLKVLTIYGPTSFFDYRGELMGVDYENVRRFAKENNMVLDIEVVPNINDLVLQLQRHEAHMAAYPVPQIAEYNDEVIYCGPQQISWQVLVQKKGEKPVKDVTQLVGSDIYVEKDSKYHYRLNNLNDELGGGLNIIPLENDTLLDEDFLEMVSRGDILYTVVDSETAKINEKDFPELDFSLHVSLDQAASWAVAPGLDSLAVKIERWEHKNQDSDVVKEIYKRYYESGKTDSPEPVLNYFIKRREKGEKSVSQFDAIFKQNEVKDRFDWELLAAIAFCESRFNSNVTSRFGATGLMQVMPSTATALGFSAASLSDPATNVKAATRLLSNLDKTLQNKIEDPDERLKFIIAAYNSGLGHIFDSMALAEKQGLDPQKWLGNVSVAVLMKSRPEFYNDPVVKHGYFRGRETVDFVERVFSIYNYLKKS